MEKKEKIKIILMTAAVLLTVELLLVVVLQEFGVTNEGFGRNGQDGNSYGVSEGEPAAGTSGDEENASSPDDDALFGGISEDGVENPQENQTTTDTAGSTALKAKTTGNKNTTVTTKNTTTTSTSRSTTSPDNDNYGDYVSGWW